MPKTILIADDDATVVSLFHLDVEGRDADITIRSSGTGQDTIKMLEQHAPDLLVLDIRMPKGDGFTVLEHLHANKMSIPVVILTNYNNAEYMKKSKTYGNVRDYLIKHEVSMNKVFNTVNTHL